MKYIGKKSVLLSALSRAIAAGLITTGLVACGSGGGGSDDSDNGNSAGGGFQEIQISMLGSQTVNEGDEVVLSLNTQNANGSTLIYEWSVDSSVGNINFSGQNTDTIRFTAPEVTQDASISVSVVIELEGGRLIGNDTQRATVFVKDTNPLNIVSGDAFQVDQTSFDLTDLAAVNDETTWLVTDYFSDTLRIEGESYGRIGAERNIAYALRSDDGALNLSYCGSNSGIDIRDLVEPTLFALVSCGQDEIASSITGTPDHFAVEHSCGGRIVSALSLKKIADSRRDDLASLSLNFDTFPTLDASANVCVQTSNIVVTDEQNEQFGFGYVNALAPYGGDILELDIDLSRPLGSTIIPYVLDDFFDEGKLNSLILNSPVLGDLSGKDVEDGTVDVAIANAEGHLKITIDASHTLDDGTENIEGELIFNFP